MSQRPDAREMMRYAAVGLEFILLFGLGVAGGMYLDPPRGMLWTLVGAGVGFAAGMYRMLQVAAQWRREQSHKDDRK